jgi:hypothetical protein
VVQLIEMPGGMRPGHTLVDTEEFQSVDDVASQWQIAPVQSKDRPGCDVLAFGCEGLPQRDNAVRSPLL